MVETLQRAIDVVEARGGKVLDYPPGDDAALHDLYDMVVCDGAPGRSDARSLAGLLNEGGVVVCTGRGALRSFFDDVSDAGDGLVVARNPRDPEGSRIDAERDRYDIPPEGRGGGRGRRNPAVGGMSWEQAIAMMRSDLRGLRANMDEAEDMERRRGRMLSWLVEGYRRDPASPLRFPLVPAARLRKAWLDYGRTGEVRDPKGVERIAERVLDNIVLLDLTNALSGHSEENPEGILEEVGVEDIDPQSDSFLEYLTDPDTGGWYVSDYGLPYLHGAYLLILRAETPEETLLAVDKALNVVHQRSDLASWFVEGVTKTLNEVSSQA